MEADELLVDDKLMNFWCENVQIETEQKLYASLRQRYEIVVEMPPARSARIDKSPQIDRSAQIETSR